jgi:hypothetical protein
MMKGHLILLLLLLPVAGLFSQTSEAEMHKQLEELRARIKTLEKENTAIKAETRSNDSLEYCSVRNQLFEAFSNITRLDAEFRNTSDKIAVTGLFTRLIQASNPTSDILGFRFTDIIYSAVDKHFTGYLPDEKERKRFGQVIGKIIDNPIVSSLANTNPITSVAAAIISTIAGYTTSKVQLQKDGTKVKDVTLAQEDAFDTRSINAFRDDLQDYIEFYDAMIIASTEFLEGIDYLNNKYDYLLQSIKSYKTDLFSELAVNESNLLIRLSKLLPDPSGENLDFHSMMCDERIVNCLKIVGKFSAMEQSANELRKEYNTLLYKFLTDFVHILDSAKNFPDKDIDKAKTGQLIKDINHYIEYQVNKDEKGKTSPQPNK